MAEIEACFPVHCYMCKEAGEIETRFGMPPLLPEGWSEVTVLRQKDDTLDAESRVILCTECTDELPF